MSETMTVPLATDEKEGETIAILNFLLGFLDSDKREDNAEINIGGVRYKRNAEPVSEPDSDSDSESEYGSVYDLLNDSDSDSDSESQSSEITPTGPYAKQKILTNGPGSESQSPKIRSGGPDRNSMVLTDGGSVVGTRGREERARWE